MASAAEPDRIAQRRQSLGAQLATFRRAADLTQGQLAAKVFRDRTTVVHVEKGRARGDERFWTAADEACAAGGALLAAFMDVEAAAAEHDTREQARRLAAARAKAAQLRGPSGGTSTAPPPVLDELRRAILGNGEPAEPQSDARQLPTPYDAAVAHAHRLYHLADYDGCVRLLPPLLAQVEPAPPPAATALAHLAAAKVARKLGDAGLAWVAADRSARLAAEANRRAHAGAASYEIAGALLAAGHLDHAEQTALTALLHLQTLPPARPARARLELTSVCGALLLLLAVMAARRQDHRAASARLNDARRHATAIGQDGNWLWTAFGPTNVAIHELSVHVALGDTTAAEQASAAIDLDALPTGLHGRRAQVHLELATAAVNQRDDSLAVLHLLEAERVATQAVSRNKTGTRLLTTLLARERRHTTPGLRALAARAGLHP